MNARKHGNKSNLRVFYTDHSGRECADTKKLLDLAEASRKESQDLSYSFHSESGWIAEIDEGRLCINDDRYDMWANITFPDMDNFVKWYTENRAALIILAEEQEEKRRLALEEHYKYLRK